MYSTGETVSFNTSKGQFRGSLLNINQYPLIDFVTLNDGLIITAYELVTGHELMNSQSFTLDDFVLEMINAFAQKNFNDLSFFKKLKSDADQ